MKNERRQNLEKLMNPAGHPSPPLPKIAPAGRLHTLQSRRLLLFNNGKLQHGNSLVLFEAFTRLFKDAGILDVAQLRKHAAFEPRDEILAAIRAIKPDAAVVGLCDSGAITVYTVVNVVYECEKMGIPTVVLTTRSYAHLVASLTFHLLPQVALLPLPEPIWAMGKEDIVKAAADVFPSVVRGLTLRDDLFKSEFDLRSSYGEVADYPEGRFLEEEMLAHDEESFSTFLYGRRLSDGMPVVLPTLERVGKMLDVVGRAGEEVVVSPGPPSWCPITIEKLAVNAVMAGCAPEFFPIVLTAFEAMASKEFDLGSTVSTTYNGGRLVMVSGPIAREIGLQMGAGCFGPGFRANATIGRTVSLSCINILRSFPGRADVATFGSPAKFTYCFAEDLTANPWRREKDETLVTVFMCDSPHNVMDHKSIRPESLLLSIAREASTTGGNNCYWPADLFIVLSPDHAAIIHNAGWSEEDVRLFLYDHARNPVEEVDPEIAQRGITPRWAKWWKSSLKGMVPVVPGPECIRVVVAGAGGPHSMVIRPWGLSRAVTRPVIDSRGRIATSIRDFVNP